MKSTFTIDMIKKGRMYFFITKKLPVASQQCLLDLQKKKKKQKYTFSI